MGNPNWTKGVSGNPDGRPPKGEALTDILREKVDKEEIAAKLIQIAMEKEDLSALKYIYDRLDGRPKETIEQTNIELPAVVGFYPDDYAGTTEEDSGADSE